MGVTMTGTVECWVEQTGGWVGFAEIQYNKWYELHRTVYHQPMLGFGGDGKMSWAVKRIIDEDVHTGFHVIPLVNLEKLWKDFDATAKATVEFMRAMSQTYPQVRLIVYFE